MKQALTISGVSGPFREPREPVFSYDYAILRPTWPMPHAVRIKVSIPAELEYVKQYVLGTFDGPPGKQLLLNQLLSRRIADQKLRIVDAEGMLSARLDVLVEPFTGPMAHLFSHLEGWVRTERDALRTEIQSRIGV